MKEVRSYTLNQLSENFEKYSKIIITIKNKKNKYKRKNKGEILKKKIIHLLLKY